MLADLPTPLLLLLHESGWDEVLMVAAGLVVAYVVIVWTGRRNKDEADDDALYDDESPADSSDQSHSDQSRRPRS